MSLFRKTAWLGVILAQWRATFSGMAGADDDVFKRKQAEIARDLRRAREDAGLTSGELGRLIGQSRQLVLDVEEGRALATEEHVGAVFQACRPPPRS